MVWACSIDGRSPRLHPSRWVNNQSRDFASPVGQGASGQPGLGFAELPGLEPAGQNQFDQLEPTVAGPLQRQIEAEVAAGIESEAGRQGIDIILGAGHGFQGQSGHDPGHLGGRGLLVEEKLGNSALDFVNRADDHGELLVAHVFGMLPVVFVKPFAVARQLEQSQAFLHLERAHLQAGGQIFVGEKQELLGDFPHQRFDDRIVGVE
jgi:hypothetical protein